MADDGFTEETRVVIRKQVHVWIVSLGCMPVLKGVGAIMGLSNIHTQLNDCYTKKNKGSFVRFYPPNRSSLLSQNMTSISL